MHASNFGFWFYLDGYNILILGLKSVEMVLNVITSWLFVKLS